MNDTLSKIKTRGSWTVRIRPEEFIPNRVQSLAELTNAVRNSHVALRGWDFPHVGNDQEIHRQSDRIEGQTDWQHYVELWRAYTSGQFISINALWGEWRDQSTFWPAPIGWCPGGSLGAEDASWRFVEIFEFAARWASAIPMGSQMIVECTLRGLKGRSLEFDLRRRSFRFQYVASTEEFNWSKRYATADVFASPRENAVEPTVRLFELFKYDAKADAIRELQNELTQK